MSGKKYKYIISLKLLIGPTLAVKAPKYIPIIIHKSSLMSNYTQRQTYVTTEILNSFITYSTLFKKSLKPEEIFETCKYINEAYTYFDIHEKALALGIWKLSQYEGYLPQIIELQTLLEENFPHSPYLWLGYFIQCSYILLDFTDNPLDNMSTAHEASRYLQLLYNHSNPHHKKMTEVILYIVYYYYSEYYLKLAMEFFENNKFPDAITYLKRILLRSHVHPIAALEALLLMIEIFCILQDNLLVEKYTNILQSIVNRYPLLHPYSLRSAYILNIYNIKK